MGILFKRSKFFVATNIFLLSVAAVFAAVCFVPSGAITANGALPYTHGNRKSDKISLMFNVYEGAEIVEGILSVLEKYGARATFFVGGCFIDDHAELLEKIARGGNEIANHGYFHRDHSSLGEEGNYDEIVNTHKVIKALSGKDMNLFAPPSGAYGQQTLKAAQNAGYSVILWSKDTIDWRDNNVKTIVRRATDGARGGDLVLMHPKAHTLQALPEILDYYKNAGLVPVTVSENIFG